MHQAEILSNNTTQNKIKTNSTQLARTTACQSVSGSDDLFEQFYTANFSKLCV